MAEFAAGHTRRKTEVADGDLLVDVLVRKVICSLGHGSNEHTDALILIQILHVLPDTHQLGLKTQGDLSTVRGEMVGNWIGDDLQQLLLRVH